MSEHLPQHEQHEHSHSAETHTEHTRSVEHQRLQAEQAAKAAELQRHKVEIATEQAEHEAKRAKEVSAAHEQRPTEASPTFVSHHLKIIARARLLKHVREHLPRREQALSKVIHQPIVNSISEVGSKTVARPSGLLAGGICAFLGSSVFLYIAKHNGYRYNFLLWALFFVGGFVVGLIIEFLAAIARRVKS